MLLQLLKPLNTLDYSLIEYAVENIRIYLFISKLIDAAGKVANITCSQTDVAVDTVQPNI